MAYLHEHIILPLADRLRGESVSHYLQQLRKAEAWSGERMVDFQCERLSELLQHAYRYVPFYRDWFRDAGIDADTTSLAKLPVVDKALMRREGTLRFASEGVAERERMTVRSSGSTGAPFAFYVSKEAYSVNMAAKLHSWEQAGYQLGDRYMKIANSPRHSLLKRWQDAANRCIYVSFASLDNSDLERILAQIDDQRPLYIRSYPSPLYLLAKRRLQTGKGQHRPHHIFTTGATLTPSYRATIEEAFGCDIIDSYSCEGTPDIYETTAHDGYHCTNYYGIVEVLDEAGQPVTDGIGRVVSTDLWNLAHPFIRYDTQDLVEVSNGRIMRIVGRDCESLLSVGNRIITTNNLDKYFAQHAHSILAYRMVQHRDNSVVLQLEVNEHFTTTTQQEIIAYWSALLDTPMSVEILDHIPLMHNNKYLTIVHEQ